ncbi:MAG TPA: dihydropyrimidinase [Actinobacteria bacterium]|nr:dihydropyrimidinase [Actinomycetota bacterium]
MEVIVFDLLLTGGTVVNHWGSVRADVGVLGGKIAAVAAPGALTTDAAVVTDATGMYVLPGGVDAHVHFDLSLTDAMSAQSSARGSRAAAFGGTTTFLDFSLQHDDESLIGSIEDKLAALKTQAPVVDYGLHAMVTGDVPFAVMDEVADAISGGVSSIKMFTTFSGASASGDLFSDDGRIWGVMQSAARHGGIVMVHCEDDCLIRYHVQRLYAQGEQNGRNIHRARPEIVEEAAIRRMILLSERSGSPLYVVHVSSELGIAAIADARARHAPVFGEVLHNYLVFTSEDYAREDGTLYHNYPPLKKPADQAALWRSLRDGSLDTVASDDFTIPRAAKLSGQVVDNVPGGHNGIETRLNVLFSEGVCEGKLSLERFVELASAAPARLFGIYPRKGAVTVGSDADLIVFDPAAEWIVSLDQLHSDCDYSIWEGRTLHGRVRSTYLRGRPLILDSKWVGDGVTGEFVPAGHPSSSDSSNWR